MEKTTIFTNDKKLAKDIETLIEQFHARDIDRNKNKEDYLCDVDLDYIRVNNIKDSKIIIIDSDSFIDIDNNHYYIQVLKPNYPHLNGVDSYIHTDDITNTILDLLHAMYDIGLISMDEYDVMEVLRGKEFNYYRFELDNPIDELNSKSLISKLYLKNKNILMVIYGDMNCSISETNYIFKEMKQKHYNEWFIGYFIDESKKNKRIINFFIEE